MSHDELSHYRDNLRHVVRPSDSTERETAEYSYSLSAWQALKLRTGLREKAHYEWAADERKHMIALAYAEYIDMCVRDERRENVQVYAQTDAARQVLVAALEDEGFQANFVEEE